MKKRLLVTGASGFLGWNVCHFEQEDWEIIGTYYQHRESIPRHIQTIALDLANGSSLEQVFQKVNPDGVLHLGAMSRINYCEQHPVITYDINVKSTEWIARWCKQAKIPFVFTSSSQVYDGQEPPYSENDKPNPITRYAHQKLTAEEKVLSIYPQACIARMPLMYGAKSPTAINFLALWLDKLKKGEKLTVFTDEIRQPASGLSASEALFILLNSNAYGIYNIAGNDVLSRAEFADIMAEVFQLSKDSIVYCQQKDIKMAANRPPNLSMNIDKIEALGYKPRGVREELEKIKNS